jgi:hypothetical protein
LLAWLRLFNKKFLIRYNVFQNRYTFLGSSPHFYLEVFRFKMITNEKDFTGDKTVVGVFATERGYQARVLPSGEANYAGGGPVYTRSFRELVLAVGFCTVLNRLSKNSVERIMKKAPLTPEESVS